MEQIFVIKINYVPLQKVFLRTFVNAVNLKKYATLLVNRNCIFFSKVHEMSHSNTCLLLTMVRQKTKDDFFFLLEIINHILHVGYILQFIISSNMLKMFQRKKRAIREGSCLLNGGHNPSQHQASVLRFSYEVYL